MQQDSFNLIHTTAVLGKRRRAILGFVLIGIAAAAITVFIMPPSYRSVVTTVPANTVLADKARLFNPNIQNLYSYFGSDGDLDRIYGIASMDVVYEELVDRFSLVNYYEPGGDNPALKRRNATHKLMRDLTAQKTDQAQLKITAWTKDAKLSAGLVNAMADIIQQKEKEIWAQHYNEAITKLDASIASMENEYSVKHDGVKDADLDGAKKSILLEQIKQYHKTADEFRLAAQTPPAALYILEKGTPAAKAERPDKLMVIIAAAIISFIFACLVVLITDRKNAA